MDSEENVQYNISIEAAQALQALQKINEDAGSIPEIIANTQKSIEDFAQRTGLSFGAAEISFKNVIADAERLRTVLENPFTASLVVSNPEALNIAANVGNPFESAGLSSQAGFKAVNDARREGIVLSQQQAKSEAAVAQEINSEVSASQDAISTDEEWLALVRERNLEEEAARKTLLATAAAKRQAYEQANPSTGAAQIKNDLTEEEYAYNKAMVAQMNYGQGAKEVGDEVESSAKRSVRGINLVSIAIRFMIYSVLFAGINYLKKLFTDAIDSVKQLETAVYNLADAEKAMSNAGVNVQFKDLLDIAKQIHSEFQGMFSQTELEKVVGNIAVLTKDLGLTTDQIKQIAEASARFQLRHPDQSISQISQTITTAVLNQRMTGLAKLGVNLDVIKQKEADLAAQLGTTTDKLTAQQKIAIEISATYDASAMSTDELAQKQNTLGGVQQRLASAWQDLLGQLGKDFAPVIIQGIKNLISFLTELQHILTVLEPVIQAAAINFAAFSEAMLTAQASSGNFLQKLKTFASVFGETKKAYQDYLKSFDTGLGDTPTNLSGVQQNQKSYQDIIKASQDKITSLMQDARDKWADIERKYQEKLQDIARNYSQKLQDIARSSADKRADALTSYNQKVADINSSAQQKEQDAISQANQKKKDIQQKYQDDLKKLREKYLMDLADALHARDARQILHLQRQYQIDKANLAQQSKQDQAQNQKDLAQKLKQIEVDRKRQLAEAQKTYDEKLKQIAINEQRERRDAAINYQRQLQDARIAHQRQLQEQQIYLQRKLRDLAEAIAKEYQLTAQGASAIYSLLNSYFGGSGLISGLGTGSVGSLSGGTSSTSVSSSSGPTPSMGIGSGLFNPYDYRTRLQQTGQLGYGMAEGGTFLATTPTTLHVAENRPEMITATPLGRPGANLNKVFTNSQGNGGGQMEIALTLSPDLEARVVRKSMDETANVIMKINRTKS